MVEKGSNYIFSSFCFVETFIGSETKYLLLNISLMGGLGSVAISLSKVVARGTHRGKPDFAMSLRVSMVLSYRIGISVERRVDL